MKKNQMEMEKLRKLSLKDLLLIPKVERDIIASLFVRERECRQKRIKKQEMWVVVEEAIVKQEKNELKSQEEKFEEHKKFLDKKRAEVKEIERELNLAKSNLKSAEMYHSELEKDITKKKEKIDKVENNIKSMKRISLIHSSATLKQLSENQLSYIVVSSTDEGAICHATIRPDKICDVIKLEKIIEIPRHIQVKTREQESIIDFCEMVANFILNAEQDQIKVVFSEPQIAEILRFNGFLVD